MVDRRSILICGLGETASAAALRLFLDGHAVALCQVTAPNLLRRRMSFSDAWFDRYATLGGVAAQRINSLSEFVDAMRMRDSIPLLRRSLSSAVENWRFDAVVASRDDIETIDGPLNDFARRSIGLGHGFSPGVDCDLVVETDGPDPGALSYERVATHRSRAAQLISLDFEFDVTAPRTGKFRAYVSVGLSIEADQPIGVIGDTEIPAPISGRLRGCVRTETIVTEGEKIAELVLADRSPVSGVSETNKLIARGVTFAISRGAQAPNAFPLEEVF